MPQNFFETINWEKADITEKPFPIVVIDNFLKDEAYLKLSKSIVIIK